MKIITGREREARLIRQANRAAAVGRLMLGQCDSWHAFLEADSIVLEDLPRRKLKSGSADVKARLTSEIRRFCAQNFVSMNETDLSNLYESVKAFRGLELSLFEFEERFSKINPKVLHGCPRHLTVCISLWGLQFKFPEEQISKDILKGLEMAKNALSILKHHEVKTHPQLTNMRNKLTELIQEKSFSIRAVVTSCFNLVEAYLNGLAWDYVQTHGTEELSMRKKKLLEDTSLASTRDKIIKYPDIITGKPLWQETDKEVEIFINIIKPFRDSLMHPSPFLAPAQFGGYDKLRLFYRIDYNTALDAATLLASLLKRIHMHVYGPENEIPTWLMEFQNTIQSNERITE